MHKDAWIFQTSCGHRFPVLTIHGSSFLFGCSHANPIIIGSLSIGVPQMHEVSPTASDTRVSDSLDITNRRDWDWSDEMKWLELELEHEVAMARIIIIDHEKWSRVHLQVSTMKTRREQYCNIMYLHYSFLLCARSVSSSVCSSLLIVHK